MKKFVGMKQTKLRSKRTLSQYAPFIRAISLVCTSLTSFVKLTCFVNIFDFVTLIVILFTL